MPFPAKENPFGGCILPRKEGVVDATALGAGVLQAEFFIPVK